MNTPLIPQTMLGSCGEHDLQERYGNRKRADAFYKHQMLSYLNPQMRTFIARQEMFFLSTADGHGECDVSFRAGEAGFVHVLDEKILVYPEYRGNGVMASLGNITENSHAGLLFVDGTLDIRSTLDFTGLVVAAGGLRVRAGGSLTVGGALWVGGTAAPAFVVDGTLRLRQSAAALDDADRLLPLPRRAVLVGVKDLS